MNVLTPQELRAWIQSGHTFRLLDVREEGEWQLVRLPGALWRPLSRLPEWIEQEAAGAPAMEVVVYCHHGVRSARVCSVLRAHGRARVWNLQGGIERWACEVEPGMIRY